MKISLRPLGQRFIFIKTDYPTITPLNPYGQERIAFILLPQTASLIINSLVHFLKSRNMRHIVALRPVSGFKG